MQTPFTTFIEAAEELQSRFEEKPTVPPLWFGELSPSAKELSSAWNQIAAGCSAESDLPPLILFDVFNGRIGNTTAVLPDKMLSECFDAVSSQPGWGSAFYAVFVWLRDPDGTKFDPMPLLAVKNAPPTVEVEITQTHAIKILKKWARHVRRMESRLKAEPAASKPGANESNSEAEPAGKVPGVKRARRTKPPMPIRKVEEHWATVMASGNRDLIQQYLTSAETKLAELIGCSRNTLRACEGFQNRRIALREFNRRNS